MEDNTQNSVPQKMLLLKGKFKSIQQNTYGLFIIYLKPVEKEFENIELVASAFSNLFDTPIGSPWAGIEAKIFDIKWNGNYTTQTTANLIWSVENSLKGFSLAEEIVSLAKKRDAAALEQKLLEIFRKTLNDNQIEFIIDFEETDSTEIQKQKKSREKKAKPEKGAFYESVALTLPEGSLLVDSLFVISPLLGIPITELKVGDWIMIRIDETKPKGKNYLFQMNAFHEGNPIPLPALVHQVTKHPDETYTVIVKLKEKVFGKINESEKVKIRKFEGEGFFFEGGMGGFKPALPPKEEIPSLKNDKLLITLLIGVVLLIAALFIYLLYT